MSIPSISKTDSKRHGKPYRPVARRWIIVSIAAVLLHVLALDWANDKIGVPLLRDDNPQPIVMVQLKPPALPAPTAVVAPQPKPRPQHHFAPLPAPVPVMADSQPAPEATIEPGPVLMPAESNALATDDQPPVNAPPPDPAPSDTARQTVKEEKPAPTQTQYRIEFPPSAELKYDVQQVPADGGHPRYGSGMISWHMGDGKYQVTGEADVLFFTLLKFTSEGGFDSYGIAPVLYSEKRFRRSETATHFNRDERNNISFSASSLSYPIKGGEQDLSSVIWELTGIGRGDREKFVPGAQIDLFVAGVRDADIWSILVVGPEDIDVGSGKTQAWHVVRVPRVGSYDKKIDIWLAPQDQWYPVKIRQTEKSGDYVDMTMTSFHPLPAADMRQAATR
jgi:hypothetical protein